MHRLWLPLSLLVLAACNDGVDTTLQISNYDTACNVPADCVPAFVGDPCTTACQCDNAAINTADVYREQSDLMAITAVCSSSPPACNESCAMPTATCTKGVCALQQ